MKETKEKKKKVFSILKLNPANCIWIAHIIIASISAIIGLINDCESVFAKGEFYYISISIISPLLVDFVIQNLEYKLQQVDNKFLTRKTITLGISIIVLVVCFILMSTHLLSSIIAQLLIYLLSAGLSLYMFCLQKLIFYYDEYKDLDDAPYHKEINKKSEILAEKKDTIKVLNDNGKEIKL